MLIFGLYEGERITLNVSPGMTVKDVREMIQKQLNISVDAYKHDKKVLVLTWAGSDLADPWVFSDLGIVPGTTIRVSLKEEVKPVLYIHCSHSQETIPVYDVLLVGHLPLDEVRTMVSRKTGLPVSIYRLTNQAGKEMYDGHRLEDYGVDIGHTIFLENLNGWNEFLNLAIMGFTPQVVSQITQDEVLGRFQMKVAMFLAAHFGHVDLARAMLRQGIRASEPIGYPPQRMWCTANGHMESLKASVHEAVEMGQLGVLRLFVNHDITVITAKDGYGLAPLNIALRKKIKNCASFLLTKQWSKVNVTKNFALHVGTYTHLRRWCDRAKERAFVKYGHAKSSLKRRPTQQGPLVGYGVTVDGFSPSIMTGKSKAELQKEKEKEKKKLVPRQSMLQIGVDGVPDDPESYFKHVQAVQNLKSMSDRIKGGGRWGKITKMASVAKMAEDLSARSEKLSELGIKTHRTPEPLSGRHDSEDKGEDPPPVKLPPILQKLRTRLTAQQPAPQQPATNTDGKDGKDGTQHVPAPPSVPKKDDKGLMMSKLVKTRGNAYFMVGSGAAAAAQQQEQQQQNQQQQQQQQHGQSTGKAVPPVPSLQLPNSERDKTTKGAPSLSEVASERSHGDSHGRSLVGESLDTVSTHTGEDGANLNASTNRKDGAGHATARTATDGPSFSFDGGSRKKKKKRKRVTSALLLSKAKSSEGAIPLPLISNEQDRRPFFYYNGKREESFIEPTICTWSKHTQSAGETPRERAIKSLTVANSFKDKPWLGQVRIALNMTSSPTKRAVRRLRGSKRTFAV